VSDDNIASLKRDISSYRVFSPIVVQQLSKEMYRILDGHKRVKSLTKLGIKHAFALIIPASWDPKEVYRSLSKHVAKHTGKSWSEVSQSNNGVVNTAINKAVEAGVPVEVVARGMFPDITAQIAAYRQSQMPPPPPPSPVSIGVLGDKGIKPLIEIMEKVGDGSIDRESAINAIIEIYSTPENPLSRQDAEKIIPDEPSETDLNRAAGLDAKGRHAPVASSPNSGGGKVSSSKPKVKATASK
jgi:hypothetical protein